MVNKILYKYQFYLNRIYIYILSKKYSNIKIGRNTKIDRNTVLNIASNSLYIGDNVYLRSNPRGYHAGMPFSTTILMDGNYSKCVIKDNCRINGCYIHVKSSLEIGMNTVIAAGTNILDSNGHEVYAKDRTKGRDQPKKIKIGENVWIGLNCTILKNTIIGDNSIVAAGSVVKGHFPPDSLIQGNPARVVKKLEI